jgi:hypothetical protein
MQYSSIVAVVCMAAMYSLAHNSVYEGFTKDVLIPFVPNSINDGIPFTNKAQVDIRIGIGNATAVYRPTLDTGTCGYVLSAKQFPDWQPGNLSQYPIGWEFLSSSKRLYSGHWIPKEVVFTAASVEVKAYFPILVVEDLTICPNYNETIDTNTCPTPLSGDSPVVTHLPEGVSLFGVGFGRQQDGQPQGNSDKNPFLNIISINGTHNKAGSDFRNGFIITKEGITIGLTEGNTHGMTFTQLNDGPHKEDDSLDWLPVPVCIAVDDMNCVNGTALFDTGISQSYLTLPLGTHVQRHKATSPSSGGNVSVLNDGSHVKLYFGSRIEDDFYVVNFTTEIRDQTPDMVITTLANPNIKAPFINTGSHFLRAWNVAFDAEGGRFGFRKVVV